MKWGVDVYTKEQQLNKNKESKLRKRKCKTCKEWFEPNTTWQVICGDVDCAITYASTEMKKKQEQSKRAFNQTDKSKLREKAQAIFNKYIRERDKDKPCISCGHTDGRQFHAGHYKSAGQNPQLRFNELNVNKQCSICNNYKSGNLAEYRINLIKKIGLENVEALECDRSTKKYSVEDYQNIIVKYKDKLTEL